MLLLFLKKKISLALFFSESYLTIFFTFQSSLLYLRASKVKNPCSKDLPEISGDFIFQDFFAEVLLKETYIPL